MKRRVSDLLDTYIDEHVDLDGDTPLSASRIWERTMSGIGRPSAANRPGRGKRAVRRPVRRHLPRGLLIAAVVGLLCCLTAVAIAFSLRDAARMDMGVSAETPIPEWMEYQDLHETGVEAEEDSVALVATMCSGKQLYAYFEISPVPEEIAAVLADNASPEYEWDLGGIHLPGGSTCNTEQTGYNPETKTALVKVLVRSEALEQMERLELKITLTHNLKVEKTYGPVVIPVTSNQMISCPADVAVTNTKAHFEEILGPNPEALSIPDYVSEGRLDRISICAGYIEVEVQMPEVAQWASVSGAGRVIDQTTDPEDLQTLPGLREFGIRGLFYKSWYVSVEEVLHGARLNYKDGSSAVIDELPHVYAGVWITANRSPEFVNEGKLAYQFIPRQAFDLSAIASITICGTEYALLSTDEIKP